MREYVRNRIAAITSPAAYQIGMETKESIYWELSELIMLCWTYMKDYELAEEVRYAREKYGKV